MLQKHNRPSLPGSPRQMSHFPGHAILCKQGRWGRGALPPLLCVRGEEVEDDEGEEPPQFSISQKVFGETRVACRRVKNKLFFSRLFPPPSLPPHPPPRAVMLRMLLVFLACSNALATTPSSTPVMQPLSMQKRLQTLLHCPSRSALVDVHHGPYPPDARPAYLRAVHLLIVFGTIYMHFKLVSSLGEMLYKSSFMKDLAARVCTSARCRAWTMAFWKGWTMSVCTLAFLLARRYAI